jgi:hypothetical protein
MEYKKIISVTGLPGLYELVSSKTDGALVRSLEDRSTKFISSRKHNFSHLESIEVYTTTENVNLADVFQAMSGSKETLPEEKDASAVKKYFEKVYPEIDFDRVYNSDMKKMVRWFAILTQNGVEIKVSAGEEPAVLETAPEEPVKEEKKPARSKAKKEPETAADKPETVKKSPATAKSGTAPKKKKGA